MIRPSAFMATAIAMEDRASFWATMLNTSWITFLMRSWYETHRRYKLEVMSTYCSRSWRILRMGILGMPAVNVNVCFTKSSWHWIMHSYVFWLTSSISQTVIVHRAISCSRAYTVSFRDSEYSARCSSNSVRSRRWNIALCCKVSYSRRIMGYTHKGCLGTPSSRTFCIIGEITRSKKGGSVRMKNSLLWFDSCSQCVNRIKPFHS